MKYDKIRGGSIAEMMMQLRSQFGNSVYILQTREIRQGGLFGSDLLSRKQYEIEYMVSEGDGAPARGARRAPVSSAPGPLRLPSMQTGQSASAMRLPEAPTPMPETAAPRGAREPRSPGLRPATAAIENNLQDLDSLIDSLKRLKEKSSNRPSRRDAALIPERPLASSVSEESSLQPMGDRDRSSEPEAEPLVAASPALRIPSHASGADGAPDGEEESDLAAGLPTREELEALFRMDEPSPKMAPTSPSRVAVHPPALRSRPRLATPPEAQATAEGEDAISKIHRRLLESQASPEFAERFMHRLERSLSEEDRLHPNRVRTRSLEKLKEMIRLVPVIEREHGERKVIFLVGPNGSGKTTSLAKLAARYHINDGAAVSVFSLDHYRLAATEQLKTYAAVLMVPFHAPVSPSEFLEFLDRDGPDYVFVDTSGMSLRDHDRLEDLRRYIDCVPGSVEVHLVLSVSTSPSLTEKYMAFFDSLGFEKIILTRLDEADFLANFVEIADKWKRPFSFLMNGQTVPEHVLRAEPEDLARMVLGLSG